MSAFIDTFFSFGFVQTYWPQILASFWLTIQMSILVIILGIALGFVLAVIRLYDIRVVNLFIIFYIDFFRAVPGLVLIILAFFALPSAGIVMSPFWATVISLSFVLSAVCEEIFWQTIKSIPRGQWEAAAATGMGFNRTLMKVIVPQTIRMAIPPLTNRSIGVTKGTSLGSVIAVPELLNITSNIQSTTANPSALTVGAILFLVVFLPFVKLTRWLERRSERGLR
jgi:cystine transport system permease protein